jgi:hypothetical protein
MTDIRFDNDLVLKNGDILLVEEPDASGQRIKHRLLTFIGEYFLDLNFGTPYYDNILVKAPRIDVISAIIKAEILKSADGEFTEFEAAIDSRARRLTVEATIKTTEGSTSVSITI